MRLIDSLHHAVQRSFDRGLAPLRREMADGFSDLRQELSTVLRRPRVYRAQLMLLWNPPEPDPSSGPGMLWAPAVFDESSGRAYAHLRIDCHVPAGAWIVGMGCHIQQVVIGNEIQDPGASLPLNFVRSRTAIFPGGTLRAMCVVES